MTDILAALGTSQLKKIKKFVEKRNIIVEEYKNIFCDMPFKFLEVPKNIYSSHHLAIIRLDNKNKSFHREIFKKLRKNKIGVQVHYIPVHLHPYYRNLGFSEGDFPNSEEYATNAISIPVYPSMSNTDFKIVVKEVKSAFIAIN